MSKESIPTQHRSRSCISPFFDQAQRTFAQGGSVKDVMKTIPWYVRYIDHRIQENGGIRTAVKPIHAVAMSAVVLGGVTLYEFARSQGVQLPNIAPAFGAIPVAISSESCANQNDINARARQFDAIRDKENARMRDGGYTVDNEASALASPWQRVEAAPHRVGQKAVASRVRLPDDDRGYRRTTPDDGADDAHEYLETLKEQDRLNRDYSRGKVSYEDYQDQMGDIRIRLSK